MIGLVRDPLTRVSASLGIADALRSETSEARGVATEFLMPVKSPRSSFTVIEQGRKNIISRLTGYDTLQKSIDQFSPHFRPSKVAASISVCASIRLYVGDPRVLSGTLNIKR